MCPQGYEAEDKMIPREKVGGGADGRMWAGEKTFSREKMCPHGWRTRWGWGEYIPQGEDASLGTWGQGEDVQKVGLRWGCRLGKMFPTKTMGPKRRCGLGRRHSLEKSWDWRGDEYLGMDSGWGGGGLRMVLQGGDGAREKVGLWGGLGSWGEGFGVVGRWEKNCLWGS
ncbi:unnamed protein product [Sphagnum jensenii]|uniref:Uncharacterized protein n=1 Tax=Sphagnum jensenii TaxID=128206 RepID=A0ABP0WKW8_9BRYO